MSKTKRASSPKKAEPKKATNIRDIHPKTLKALNLMFQARHDVLYQYMTIVRKDILSRLSDMEDRSESRLPAPAEAKEEPLKVGDYIYITDQHTHPPFRNTVVKVRDVFTDGPLFDHPTTRTGGRAIAGMWRRATEAEISAHQLKIQEAAKKAAEEAERAKPIAFSAPIMYHDRKGVFLWKEGANAYKLALSTTDTYSGQTVVAIRSEFKVLTD
jgi:hypothetical protein